MTSSSLVRSRPLLSCLFLLVLSPSALPPSQAQQAHSPYPDVKDMIREPFDKFLDGTVACGWEALRHRMRGNIYRSRSGRLDAPKLT